MAYQIISCPENIIKGIKQIDSRNLKVSITNEGKLRIAKANIEKFFDYVYFMDNRLKSIEFSHINKTVKFEF